jgi:hypothetical protein
MGKEINYNELAQTVMENKITVKNYIDMPEKG